MGALTLLKRAAVAVSLVLALSGCIVGPRQISATIPGPRGVLTVAVIDHTGWLRTVRLREPVIELPRVVDGVGIGNSANDPSVLLVSWTDDGCTATATITMIAVADRLAFSLVYPPRRCFEDIGIGRMVELAFDRPVPPESVDVTYGR